MHFEVIGANESIAVFMRPLTREYQYGSYWMHMAQSYATRIIGTCGRGYKLEKTRCGFYRDPLLNLFPSLAPHGFATVSHDTMCLLDGPLQPVVDDINDKLATALCLYETYNPFTKNPKMTFGPLGGCGDLPYAALMQVEPGCWRELMTMPEIRERPRRLVAQVCAEIPGARLDVCGDGRLCVRMCEASEVQMKLRFG